MNLQGDEPEIDPAYLDLMLDLLARNNAAVATLAVPITDGYAPYIGWLHDETTPP